MRLTNFVWRDQHHSTTVSITTKLQNEPKLMRPAKMRPLRPWLSLLPLSHCRQIHSSTRNSAIRIEQLLARTPDQSSEPETVEVNGRVRSVRRQKTRAFASIGDGTSLEPLQAVLTPEQAEKYDLPLLTTIHC